MPQSVSCAPASYAVCTKGLVPARCPRLQHVPYCVPIVSLDDVAELVARSWIYIG